MHSHIYWITLALLLGLSVAQNVGIGTNAPASRLHVAGLSATLTVGPFGIGQAEGRIAATGGVAELTFVDRNLTSWPSSPSAGNRYTWYNVGGIARLWTPNTDLVYITDQGYVGVGASPTRPFLVQKNAPANTHTAAFVNSSGYGIYLGNVNNATYGSIQAWGGGSARDLILQMNGGYVGINITTPQAPLHAVAGIEASLPDYNVKSAILSGDGCVELLRNPSLGATPCTGVWGYIDFKDNREDDHDGRIQYGTAHCDGGTEQAFRFLRGLNGNLSVGIYDANGWGHSSDAQRKTDIQPMAGALERVLRLQPVYFRWKAEPQRRQMGFLAQEVASIFPEAVSYDEESGYILYHGMLTAPLAGAIQELHSIIQEQAEEIRRLKARIEALEAQKR